jgi:hypothetical protein
MRWWSPSAAAAEHFSGEDAPAMTFAPIAAATPTAAPPVPPADPSTKTDSPDRSAPRCRKSWRAVPWTIPNPAASANVIRRNALYLLH